MMVGGKGRPHLLSTRRSKKTSRAPTTRVLSSLPWALLTLSIFLYFLPICSLSGPSIFLYFSSGGLVP